MYVCVSSLGGVHLCVVYGGSVCWSMYVCVCLCLECVSVGGVRLLSVCVYICVS